MVADPGGTRPPRRLCTYSLGFLRQQRVRRILALAGWDVRFCWPGPDDRVGVWGRKPVSRRGFWVSRRSGAPVLTVEDGFLRSVRPGVLGEPPVSLILDDAGIYYDASAPSALERMLQDAAPSPAHLARARRGIDALRKAAVSKYTPPVVHQDFGTGYVLVVDQTAGDASITGAGADAARFGRMLDAARAENPGKRLLVKSHPDVTAGKKRGHFGRADLSADETLVDQIVNPWDLIEGAGAVYTVSSQLGYEAVLAGRMVRTFGSAFYAGWGLTEDEHPTPRRTRRLTVEALFAGCHLDYPVYYDPWHDRLCDFETALDVITHQVRAQTPPDDRTGEVFGGVRLWKRNNVASFRPRLAKAPRFTDGLADAAAQARREDRALWAWASKAAPEDVQQLHAEGIATGFVEDGFLRSVGLGAELTEAASLVFDRKGIYFDPTGPSDLEDLINAAPQCADTARAARLRQAIVAARVTKYNVGSTAPRRGGQGRPVILVPGQVEDDASILRGCGEVRSNLGLLTAAREASPEAWIVYKPHPDVEAGLRAGAVPRDLVDQLADQVAHGASAADLLDQADALWTLTSLMGFEALLRGIPVTCLGLPFYAGWGLTSDLGPVSPRRTARPTLDALVWAALIAYPSYRDPVTGLACPPELIVERLGAGTKMRKPGWLSKLQGLFASQSWLWRR